MIEIEYQPTNREKSISPRLGKFWCPRCDASLVTAGGKCKACGAKAGKYYLKK